MYRELFPQKIYEDFNSKFQKIGFKEAISLDMLLLYHLYVFC